MNDVIYYVNMSTCICHIHVCTHEVPAGVFLKYVIYDIVHACAVSYESWLLPPPSLFFGRV